MKKIIVILSTTCYLLLSPALALATTGLSLSPPVTEILLAPNKTVSTTLQLTNAGDPTQFSLSLHTLIPTDDQGHTTINPQPLDPTSIPLIIRHVGHDFGTPLTLPPSGPLPLTLEIEAANVDRTTDVYLALLARPLVPDSPTAQATPGLAALLLITVTPDATLPTNLNLDRTIFPRLHDTSQPLRLTPILTNQTPIMTRVIGTLTLSSPSAKVIATSKIDPTLILGQTSRQLPSFSPTLAITHLGPHTLSLVITTEGGKELLAKTTTIWLLPLRALLLLFAASLIIITIIKTSFFRLTKTPHKA